MKRLLLSLALIVGLAGLLYAANDHYETPTSTAMSGLWTKVYHDTFTIDTLEALNDGPYVIKFSEPVYNVQITDLGTDSDYVTVTVKDGAFKAIENAHTVAENLNSYVIGDNNEADTVSFYFGVREIELLLTVTGPDAADSDGVLIEVIGFTAPKFE